MTPTLQSLGIDKLPLDQRLALFDELWQSIAAEKPSGYLTDAKKADLDRRIAEDDANPDAGTPWEEVLADIHARYKTP